MVWENKNKKVNNCFILINPVPDDCEDFMTFCFPEAAPFLIVSAIAS